MPPAAKSPSLLGFSQAVRTLEGGYLKVFCNTYEDPNVAARDSTSPHRDDFSPLDWRQRINNQTMDTQNVDTQNIQVQTLGRKLSLPTDLSEAVHTLRSEGGLCLKGVISKSPGHIIRADIIFNDVIRSILFQTRESFYITSCLPYEFDRTSPKLIQDPRFKGNPKITAVWCIAFLGDKVTFTMDVGKGSREQPTEERATFIMEPGDIFMCSSWLPRTLPSIKEQGEAQVVFVHYLCADEPFPVKEMNGELVKQADELADQILGLGQRGCLRQREKSPFVVWKPNKED